MRIVFMGTPDFAVPSLNALVNAGHEIAAVFTQPDKPRNRGKKVSFSPVKETALSHGFPVEQPVTLKTPEALESVKMYAPDCIAVAAYGMILPQSVLDVPEYGCLNVHASLLPKYRGAAPINRCIMNGETESGITVMQMEKGLDTGDMLLRERVEISEDMTASRLHDILADLGGRLLVEVIDILSKNPQDIQRVKQNDEDSTYASMLVKEECELDFSRSAKELNNFIRGLADYPCAYTFMGDKRIKVYRSVLGESEGIRMICGDNSVLTLTEIQPEGKKRMKATDFMKGNHI